MSELDYIQDIVYDVAGVNLGEIKLREFILKIPVDIRFIGEQWGCGDTVLIDKLLTWLKVKVSIKEDLAS